MLISFALSGKLESSGMLVTVAEHPNWKPMLNWAAELAVSGQGRVRGQKCGSLSQAVFTWFPLRHHSLVCTFPGAFQTG